MTIALAARLSALLLLILPLTACREKSLCPGLPDFSMEAEGAKVTLTGTWIDGPGSDGARSAAGFRINTVDLQCWKERKACVEAFAFMMPKISAWKWLAPSRQSLHAAQRRWLVT